VLSIDGVCTFIGVVIIDPTQVDWVSRVATIVVGQTNDDFYCNQFLADMFFLLAIKSFWMFTPIGE
jgi:hypothetical protein